MMKMLLVLMMLMHHIRIAVMMSMRVDIHLCRCVKMSVLIEMQLHMMSMVLLVAPYRMVLQASITACTSMRMSPVFLMVSLFRSIKTVPSHVRMVIFRGMRVQMQMQMMIASRVWVQMVVMTRMSVWMWVWV